MTGYLVEMIRTLCRWLRQVLAYLDEAADECSGGTGRDYHPGDPRWRDYWPR